MGRSVEYEGQLQPADFRHVFALHVRRASRSPTRVISAVVLGGLIGLGIWLSHPPLATLIAILASLLVIIAYIAWSVAQRLRRSYAQRGALHVSFHTPIDDDGFRTVSSLYDDRRSWAIFQRWIEDANYILLYESEDIFRIMPKRFLGSEGRVAELCDVLTAHLGSAS